MCMLDAHNLCKILVIQYSTSMFDRFKTLILSCIFTIIHAYVRMHVRMCVRVCKEGEGCFESNTKDH